MHCDAMCDVSHGVWPPPRVLRAPRHTPALRSRARSHTTARQHDNTTTQQHSAPASLHTRVSHRAPPGSALFSLRERDPGPPLPPGTIADITQKQPDVAVVVGTPPEVKSELGRVRRSTPHIGHPWSARHSRGVTGALLPGFRFCGSKSGCQTKLFTPSFFTPKVRRYAYVNPAG